MGIDGEQQRRGFIRLFFPASMETSHSQCTVSAGHAVAHQHKGHNPAQNYLRPGGVQAETQRCKRKKRGGASSMRVESSSSCRKNEGYDGTPRILYLQACDGFSEMMIIVRGPYTV